jgi:hypothetical protein
MEMKNVTERETIEILRLIEETRKFTAEQHKLIAAASKFRIERWLAPIIIVAGGLGSFTASWAAIGALLRIAVSR